MNYREIIAEAWIFTQENKRLIVWYAFIPSILTTVIGVLYIIYQFFAFKSSELFENWDHSFLYIVLNTIYDFVRSHLDNLWLIVIALLILLLMYLILPPIAEGAAIQLIARKKNKQPVRIRDGLSYGLMTFLPLFSYSLISRSFNLFTIVGEGAFMLRNLPLDVFKFLLPIIILVFIIGVIASLIFVFTPYYLVIDDCGIVESMSKSAKLVIRHWNKAIMMYLLMLIIAVRILLQIVFVLAVPVGIFTLIYFVAASSIPFGGFLIGGFFSLIALIFASYLGAIVHVFTTSVWIFTFLELTAEPEVSARQELNPRTQV